MHLLKTFCRASTFCQDNQLLDDIFNKGFFMDHRIVILQSNDNMVIIFVDVMDRYSWLTQIGGSTHLPKTLASSLVCVSINLSNLFWEDEDQIRMSFMIMLKSPVLCMWMIILMGWDNAYFVAVKHQFWWEVTWQISSGKKGCFWKKKLSGKKNLS